MKFLIAFALVLLFAIAPASAQALTAETFRRAVIMSDAFEIASSRLALQRSGDPVVRDFARGMIYEHSMSSAALGVRGYAAAGASGPRTGTVAGAGLGLALAGPVGLAVGAGAGYATSRSVGLRAAGLPPGTALAPHQAAMLDQLAFLSGPAFDRAYARAQISAHREAVGLFETYLATGEHPSYFNFAQHSLPNLQHHLASARHLWRRVR